jgi:hypothetical protein
VIEPLPASNYEILSQSKKKFMNTSESNITEKDDDFDYFREIV